MQVSSREGGRVVVSWPQGRCSNGCRMQVRLTGMERERRLLRGCDWRVVTRRDFDSVRYECFQWAPCRRLGAYQVRRLLDSRQGEGIDSR
jgi:hypothetical protein